MWLIVGNKIPLQPPTVADRRGGPAGRGGLYATRHTAEGRYPVLRNAKLVSFGFITQVHAKGVNWIPRVRGMT